MYKEHCQVFKKKNPVYYYAIRRTELNHKMAKIADVVIFFLLFPVSEVTIIQNTKPKADAESNTGERADDIM